MSEIIEHQFTLELEKELRRLRIIRACAKSGITNPLDRQIKDIETELKRRKGK